MSQRVRSFIIPVFILAALLIVPFAFAQERCAPAPGTEAFGTMAPASQPLAKTTSQWISGTPLPVEKKYHTVASYKGEVFVFGGVTSGDFYNAKCYRYNPLTDRWTVLSDFPQSKWLYGQAQTVGDKIYIFAGLENLWASHAPLPHLYEYDPATDKYTLKASMPLQQAWCASGVIDGKIYVIAGNGSSTTNYLSRVQVYDPASNTWSTATDYPKLVRWCSAANVNNTIVVTGGYNTAYPSYYVADTYVGELQGGTLKWTRVKDYPIGQIIYPSGVGIGDHAYFFGGRPATDNNQPCTRRSFRYTPSANTWEVLPLKPTGHQTMIQAGTDGSRIIAAGGEDTTTIYNSPTDPRKKALDVVEIFDPADQANPLLVLAETSVKVIMKRGAPIVRSFVMKNNGAAPLTWSAAVDPASAWLSLSRNSGTINPVGTELIDLTFTADGTPNGTHAADIVITANDPAHPTTPIPVSFHVQDEDIDVPIHVLVEEGTGTWCGFCPYGADTVHAIVQRFPGRVHAISYHGGSGTEPMLTPFVGPWTKLVGLTGWPGATANRTAFEGEKGLMLGSRTEWSPRVEQILTTKRSPVSLKVVDGGCDPATRFGYLTVEIFFHQPLTKQLRLSAAQVEDGFNWRQSFYPPSGGSQYVYPYFHENVLLQLIPNDVFGEPVGTGATIASQTKITKTLFFGSKDSVREKSRFVIFLHESDGNTYGEVLQSIEEEMSQLTGISPETIPTRLALKQNYPNPFNPATMIEYSLPVAGHVTLHVYDFLGREVETLVNATLQPGTHRVLFGTGHLSSGTYLYQLRAGGESLTRKMVLLK